VLVVDGAEETRDRYATELAAAGFMVLEAPDGATGIEKAIRFGPHAVVLELVLPGLDGYKVVRRLRAEERTHDAAIIAVASLGTTNVEALALASGCDAVLTKPVLAAAVVGEIVRLLAARRTGADMSRVTKR
jgi:DNA-binding response OmpR family regulator